VFLRRSVYTNSKLFVGDGSSSWAVCRDD